jgi:uncharacterized protein
MSAEEWNLNHRTGLGLRTPYLQEILASRPSVGWFEVHSENYFGGGALICGLEAVRRDYPIALHGVALGLLSTDALDLRHLDNLARLISRIEPALVSEHLCWTRLDGVHYHDLLPAPATRESLDLVVERLCQIQARLNRQIAVENITRYIEFSASTIEEGEYLRELVHRSGCALLVDLENLYLNEINLGVCALDVLRAVPAEAVVELHIAGHEQTKEGPQIDTHGAPIPEAVWALLLEARKLFGAVPTLVERDNNLPPLNDLLMECERANRERIPGPMPT